MALAIRFSSSSVSTRSEFQIIERSNTLMSLSSPQTSVMRRQPLSSDLLGAEDGGVLLHGALHLVAQHRGRRLPLACRSRSKRSMIFSAEAWLMPGIAASRSTTWPARIAAARPKTTRSISELEPSRLAPCTEAQPASPTAIRPGDDAVGVVGGRVEHLAPIVRRDAAHIVVHRRQHRDRLARHVDAGEDLGALRDARQPLMQHRRIEMVEVQEDVVLVLADARGLRGSRSSCSARPRRATRGPWRWARSAP